MSRVQVIRVGAQVFYEGGPRTQIEWESAAGQLLEEGKPFAAYDLARIGSSLFPKSLPLAHSLALAMIRTGAPGSTRSMSWTPIAADGIL